MREHWEISRAKSKTLLELNAYQKAERNDA